MISKAVGQPVGVRAHAERIACRQGGAIVAEYPGCFGRIETIQDPWHYVPVRAPKHSLFAMAPRSATRSLIARAMTASGGPTHLERTRILDLMSSLKLHDMCGAGDGAMASSINGPRLRHGNSPRFRPKAHASEELKLQAEKAAKPGAD